MNKNNCTSDLGPWAHDDLMKTANLNLGIGADSTLPKILRFLAGVARLIRRRIYLEKQNMNPKSPAIFLLHPRTDTVGKTFTLTRIPMLDNGLTSITGRLWFVNPVVASGKFIDTTAFDDDGLFHFITDELSLGNVPAIIYDPRNTEPVVRFYPSGLIKEDNVQCINIDRSDISLKIIFESIDKIYMDILVTPDGQSDVGKLWKDSEKFIPTQEAEKTIQMYLRAGLTGAFPTCTIREEQPSVAGRLDLEIEEGDPINRTDITRYAILELKVLRSYRSSGKPVPVSETLNWVEEGVLQAAEYRRERKAIESALCCFDMRKKETGENCFTHIKDKAKKMDVVLKLWFIYASSKHYRKAINSD